MRSNWIHGQYITFYITRKLKKILYLNAVKDLVVCVLAWSGGEGWGLLKYIHLFYTQESISHTAHVPSAKICDSNLNTYPNYAEYVNAYNSTQL